MTSSIPLARGVVFDRLYAHLHPGVQVTYGQPDAKEEGEVVALLRTVDPEEEPVAIGAGSKDETYDIEVGVKVHKRAGTAREVDERGYELADQVAGEVEDTTDYTLGGTVMWARLAGITGGPALPAEGGGWVIFLRVLIRCRSRINRRLP